MRTKTLIEIIAALLILLYVYTGVSKLIAFNDFRMQMGMQVLPAWSKDLLIRILPVGELLLAVLLLLPAVRKIGLWISALVLTAFTIYVSLALLNVIGPYSLFLWRGAENHGLDHALLVQLILFAVKYLRYKVNEQGKEDCVFIAQIESNE